MEKCFDSEKFKEILDLLSGHASQEAIAASIGTTQSTISKWTRKNSKMTPDINSLIKLADIYNCTIEELIGLKPIVGKDCTTIKKICKFLIDIHEEAACEFVPEPSDTGGSRICFLSDEEIESSYGPAWFSHPDISNAAINTFMDKYNRLLSVRETIGEDYFRLTLNKAIEEAEGVQEMYEEYIQHERQTAKKKFATDNESIKEESHDN